MASSIWNCKTKKLLKRQFDTYNEDHNPKLSSDIIVNNTAKYSFNIKFSMYNTEHRT